MTIPHTEADTILHRQTFSEISTQQALEELAAIRERRLKSQKVYQEKQARIRDAENDKKKEKVLKSLDRIKKQLAKADELLAAAEKSLITVQVLEMELSYARNG